MGFEFLDDLEVLANREGDVFILESERVDVAIVVDLLLAHYDCLNSLRYHY